MFVYPRVPVNICNGIFIPKNIYVKNLKIFMFFSVILSVKTDTIIQ